MNDRIMENKKAAITKIFLDFIFRPFLTFMVYCQSIYEIRIKFVFTPL